MNELKLADLGEGMHEAEVVEWLIHEGDTVRLDQPVVRVETDKAIVEIPSPVAGRVSEIRFQPGQTVKVGEVLAVYDAPQGRNGATGKEASAAGSGHGAPAPGAPIPIERTRAALAEDTAPANGTGTKRRVLAAPAVRKLAFELGIDLADVTPSASNGRVTLGDVRAHAAHAVTKPAQELSTGTTSSEAGSAPVKATPVLAPVQDERQPLTGLRRRIAEHMERSWRTIPHATAFDEVDAGELVALRAALLPAAEKRGVRLTYIPLLVKLLLPVLKEFPIFNASLDEEKREIIYKRVYHIGVATASPEGLLVPVLREADKLSVVEIAARLERLIEGAKQRSLALNELSGSTFTLNNVGSFGGSSGTPIINHPEVAILAVGRIEEKAIVRAGSIVALPRMPLALSFDHRLIDGALSGAFLARFKELVEHPQQLLLDMI
ncbi:MAG TPA: dihydrolipoamide acetyltransferase family protein [Ktedonobacteraceae bacterium]|nr:dihydrolipoamide acetyltransferase family protein [Ktedonobacteraceae bacterium]